MKKSLPLLGAFLMLFGFSQVISAAVVDRVRCKISTSTVVGEPNQVQINVKIDEAFADTPVNVQVYRSQAGTQTVYSSTHMWPDIEPYIIDGTVGVTWDSAPDPLIIPTEPELLIAADFAMVDDEITAVAIDANGVLGIVSSMTAICKEKVGQMFRQDTKTCKQKDYDRGRCSLVTE